MEKKAKDSKIDKARDNSPNQNKTIPIVEESLSFDKVREETAEVIISKSIQEFEESLDIPLKKDEININRVKVGKVVEQYPTVREIDGKTIILIVREELVVTKRLILEEQIQVTKSTKEEVERITETLRKDVVNIDKKKF
ncbi:DUF2382 domain-containing protein [Flavobacteriaceae bacterium Ap0902]|nr:DUF2382 domain-containing protein [Flavobacteriaceae bacterium Ap0902]